MMQSHPIRSPNDAPSGDGTAGPAAPREQHDAVEPGAARPSARVSFGEELRRERELRQVGLREISDATKINQRYLEALERDDFTDLPGGLFNRSFVRAYCQTIGIDADTMVNAYLLEEQIQAKKADRFDPGVWRGDPVSRGASGQPVFPVGAERPSRKVWWVVALVVVVVSAAVLAYLFIWPGPVGAAPAETTRHRDAAPVFRTAALRDVDTTLEPTSPPRGRSAETSS